MGSRYMCGVVVYVSKAGKQHGLRTDPLKFLKSLSVSREGAVRCRKGTVVDPWTMWGLGVPDPTQSRIRV